MEARRARCEGSLSRASVPLVPGRSFLRLLCRGAFSFRASCCFEESCVVQSRITKLDVRTLNLHPSRGKEDERAAEERRKRAEANGTALMLEGDSVPNAPAPPAPPVRKVGWAAPGSRWSSSEENVRGRVVVCISVSFSVVSFCVVLKLFASSSSSSVVVIVLVSAPAPHQAMSELHKTWNSTLETYSESMYCHSIENSDLEDRTRREECFGIMPYATRREQFAYPPR